MEHLWFRAKRYGYGWYPATWQGWAVLCAYLVLTIGNIFRFHLPMRATFTQVRPFLMETLVLTIVLLLVCYRTGEKLGWHWGEKKSDHA